MHSWKGRKGFQALCGMCLILVHVCTCAWGCRCPTRLLDWTMNPNVAMHFLTAHDAPTKDPGQDGIIWWGLTPTVAADSLF